MKKVTPLELKKGDIVADIKTLSRVTTYLKFDRIEENLGAIFTYYNGFDCYLKKDNRDIHLSCDIDFYLIEQP